MKMGRGHRKNRFGVSVAFGPDRYGGRATDSEFFSENAKKSLPSWRWQRDGVHDPASSEIFAENAKKSQGSILQKAQIALIQPSLESVGNSPANSTQR
jgi:hypothetical protein